MISSGNLRFRLLLGATCWIAVALLAAFFGLSHLFNGHVERRLNAELINHLAQLTAALDVGGPGAVTLQRELSDPRFQKPYGGLYWQINDDEGPVLRSRSLWDVTLDVPPDDLHEAELHYHDAAGPGRVPLMLIERGVRLGDDGERALRLLIAADRVEIAAAGRTFELELIASLAVLALGLIFAALIQVWVGLLPLQGLRAGLAEIRSGRSRHLSGRYPNEVQPLVDDLNALIAQDADALERARAQAGNLAHSLKSSLTALMGEAQVLADSGQVERGARVRREVGSIKRTVDHHLARARAAGARRYAVSTCVLGHCVEGLRRAMRRLHEDRALVISTRIAGDHIFKGEAQDLEEMLGNLIDNACKWASHKVEVISWRDGANLVVCVDDDGPGLPAARRHDAFARGARLDVTVAGSGLGLAIVRDVAEDYGGTVELEDSPLGGLRARLTLPAAEPRVLSPLGVTMSEA